MSKGDAHGLFGGRTVTRSIIRSDSLTVNLSLSGASWRAFENKGGLVVAMCNIAGYTRKFWWRLVFLSVLIGYLLVAWVDLVSYCDWG